MKSSRIPVMLVVAALVAASALAQTRGNGRLSGKVLDEQGQPIIDVIVKAQMAGQTESFPGKTDKKGEWRINGLADGQWTIEMSKDGLETLRQTIEVRDERAAPFNVVMKKPAPKVDPSVAINAELQRAVGLAQAGKFAEARQICQDLLAKDPTLLQCYGFIGRMYSAEKEPAKALESVKMALEKDPNNVDTKLLLADLMIEGGDKVEGRKLLDSIDLTQVKDPFPFMNAAITMINEGKGAEAVEGLTKLLAQFPTQNEIYYYRGRAYLAASKFDEARADLEKFIALAPTSKEAVEAKKILDQMIKK
jgi:tetratricopeptide (TPR) repeat protein